MAITDVITAYIRDQVLSGRTDIVLTPTTNLVEEEILDSLGIFSMVNFLEDEFSLEIDPEDLTADNFTTIVKIEAFVASKQGAEASEP